MSSIACNLLAPRVGLEPTTLRLTAECSTIELPRNNVGGQVSLHQTTLFKSILSRSGRMRLASPLGPFRRFNLAHPKLLILKRGCLASPLYRKTSRRSGGNVGIARAISKGGGKSGKPGVGFPGFPRTVISTAFRSMCFGSLLLLVCGSAEAIRLRSGLQDMSAISDSIQQRFAEPRVGDYLGPL